MLKVAGALGVLCVIAFILYKAWQTVRKRALKRIDSKRKSFSRNEFIDYMEDNNGTDRRLSGYFYDVLMDFLPYGSFTVYPLDNLHHILGITRNQVRDILTDTCLALNIKNPTLEDQERYEGYFGSLCTVEDVAVFMDWWHRKQ